MWHYLRDPTVSHFDTIQECDRQTDSRRRHTALLSLSLSLSGINKKKFVIFNLFAQKPSNGWISTKFCIAVEVVDVITCDKFFIMYTILWGSNIKGSNRLSQWLLTQGCATAPPVIADYSSAENWTKIERNQLQIEKKCWSLPRSTSDKSSKLRLQRMTAQQCYRSIVPHYSYLLSLVPD